ncbi:MAG: hypothetical protein COW24_02475 [Candidatus Kerfeldbacteria bacterium CG15_BIG_FIL_POST_REV_8_21_14_020_45_12]|uniref:Dihydrodipicolinate synthase family protein n=1 Tax=Candidatus Kerfeldbacteria bacterium CG15_BIG_FIL_POST_REV_8_21_14_020_45_12 TaxID=2014247 RepID=A0A2M7H452_9BACT|nr:MAG: hypothetical protein COW24_02475 [Candidatus Kerfeldbacteria bacterium CG15_BIG_FIL_POST_REV_8_21_14_020_45_12]PJA92855.1 MAG: hypothetical protein CO132_05650 [Candidatus Kerfeldbacteria bacterium CG_4_9_14_3_um_filter_45_8]
MKKQLLLPIISPFNENKVDKLSLQRLVEHCSAVDIFIPCLSSGEGGKLSKTEWIAVVRTVRAATKKPVYAGILKPTEEIEDYISIAADIGCDGIVLPIGELSRSRADRCILYSQQNELNVIFYNTEYHPVKDVAYLKQIAAYENVVGFKDSTMDAHFFRELRIAAAGTMAVYQGMEMSISAEQEVDGYCIALANVEPQLCAALRDGDAGFDWAAFKKMIQQYNLPSSTWYITLKALLYARGVITSAEEHA